MDILFRCGHCHQDVRALSHGTRHRNHCPACLWSKHLDLFPGDRAAECSGLMEPIAVWLRQQQEWALIHRCTECGHLSSNRIAPDDNEVMLLALAAKPLSHPPFPLEYLSRYLQEAEQT